MTPAPGNEHAYIHYLTMLAWHRDGQRTGTLLSTLFFITAGFDFVMFIVTGSVPFAFFAGFAAIVCLAGFCMVHHHGKKMAQWQKRLDRVSL